MKAIILSAGQGRRLLPLTSNTPKCLLRIRGRAVLDWQLDALVAARCQEIVVVSGYGAGQVEALLAGRRDAATIRTLFNPFYAVSNNLASCWVAQQEMDEDFLLLHGDVLLQQGALEHVLAAPSGSAAVPLAIDKKPCYDEDDMKVRLEERRLVRIGKDLPPGEIDAESIGVHLFRGRGPRLFREGLDAAMRTTSGLDRWYLTVVDELARTGVVGTASIEGFEWAEIDTRADLAEAEQLATHWEAGVPVTGP